MAIPFLGRHMVPPAFAALTVAAIRGVPLARASASRADTQSAAGRLEVVRLSDGVTLPLDHHKNSAESLVVTVELAAQAPGRRILVTASLRESAPQAGSALRDTGARIAESFADVIAIGDDTEDVVEAAIAAGFRPERAQRTAPGVRDAIERLRVLLRPGDVVLVKARIYWKLDRLVLAPQGLQVACDLTSCGLFDQLCRDCPDLTVARTGRFG